MPDPVDVAMQFIRAEKSKKVYRADISYFLKWSGLAAGEFVERASSQPKWAESILVNYVQSLSKRGLAGSTVGLYLATVRALLEYNDVTGINWRKLKKALPLARSYGSDRAPSLEEVRRILAFCDVRSRAILLCLVSGGFRVGSFDYFTLRDFSVIKEREEVQAGRLVVYRGEREEYFAFLTPEAAKALEEYLELRRRSGEVLSPSSPLFRDSWETGLAGSVEDVKPLKSGGASALILRILLQAGFKEREFKEVHGFRKFFKTRAEQAMKSVYVEILMGHSLGLANSYLKPTERELLQEYLKAVPYLTIQEAAELKRELSEKDADIQKLGQILEEIRFRVEYLEQRDRLEGR